MVWSFTDVVREDPTIVRVERRTASRMRTQLLLWKLRKATGVSLRPAAASGGWRYFVEPGGKVLERNNTIAEGTTHYVGGEALVGEDIPASGDPSDFEEGTPERR